MRFLPYRILGEARLNMGGSQALGSEHTPRRCLTLQVRHDVHLKSEGGEVKGPCEIHSGVCCGYGGGYVYRYGTRYWACERCRKAITNEDQNEERVFFGQRGEGGGFQGGGTPVLENEISGRGFLDRRTSLALPRSDALHPCAGKEGLGCEVRGGEPHVQDRAGFLRGKRQTEP